MGANLAKASILGAVACAAMLAAAQPASAADSVKLTGCLVKAESNDGYLVTNTPAEPAMVGTAGSAVAPDAFGGVGSFSTIIYWLENDDDLKAHVGHRVEVEGDLKGELKDGEIKVDRNDRWTELELKADGRTLKANVPNASVVAGKDGKASILVRRVGVEKVKMLEAACN
jgi:hypothetical protein